MKKLGVNNVGENNRNGVKNKDGTNKKTIEVNKNMRRLTFLNNESSDSIEGNKSKYDKNKVKEINDVFKNCMVALSHNKICTRNAFDIHIIEHLEDLINLNDEEIPEELNDEMIENGEFNLSFTRASKAIEGATKVYGYRVEAIYDQTYNFLTNMNLAKQLELDNDTIDDNKNGIDPLNKRMRKRKLTYLQESSTLAKSSDIIVDSLSLSNISVDTFFLKLNSTYDHSCGQKYLLPNLNLNNDLSIQFDGDIDVCEYKKRRKNLDDTRKDIKEKENIIDKDINDYNCDTYDMITYNNNDYDKIGEKKKNDVEILKTSNKENESNTRNMDRFDMNEHKEFFDIYKKKLFLNADILKEILYGGPDDFNSLNICPELDYFKEELKKHKLKRTDSKDTDEVDKEDVDGNLYNDDEIDITDKNNIINFYDENLGCNMSNNMLLESIYKSDALNVEKTKMYGPNGSDMAYGNLNEEIKNNNMNNMNNLNISNCDNNDLYLGEYRMDDLNIENIMQESLVFDNMNYSCDKNINFNNNNNGLLLQQSSHMMDGMDLPELINSEKKELYLGNTQINNEHYLLKNNDIINKRDSIISEVPDDDTLWNRSVMTFENRINAIDINNDFNYHYYIPSKLMMMGNFRNLIDINKNVTNNINNNKSTILQSIIMQKKMKDVFDVTSIDFENLYIENNNIELSTYDLWKKEKKKYVSNALFCIDQTSYIFDTRENCVNCVNTVADKIMKFSKFCVYPDFMHASNKNRNKHNNIINNNNNNNNNNNMNVILNEVNDDNFLNDIDPINQDDFNNNIDHFDMDNIDDMNDGHIQQGLNEAIDKFYNMDFDNIWTHNDNENISNMNNNNNLNNSTYNNNNNNNLSLFKKHSNFFNNTLFQFHHSNTFGSVPFENISKFVDVAKIKNILCDIVKPNEEEEKDNKNDSICEYQTDKDNQIVTYTAEKTTTFEEIVKKTTEKLNESEASSTSIHMLFVCLLYTCNDQELLLEKIPNQNNFYVRYGLPAECHVNQDDVPMLKN
ncbi:putative chromosome condensation protein [Plasmodium gaboni]|uniref:Condensin complex subunit 2 n=1 Tax=Plasmodium gaboni TaxID=647221 RepID=A0A151LD09_9APIC|nr:putative chromosome condensation protein [Plasmodium gaboni]KYN96842.1 putative chromosome condensation protein [Plasmodium gaboni]